MVSRTAKIVLILIALALNACSAGYIVRAAYEQAKIMSRREKIDNLLEDPATNPADKKKLALVIEARAYAKEIGLDPKNTFKKYARLDSDVLSWVLLASKPDAFELYTWWFPIVGTVPYKGFFEKKDAEEYAEGLLKKGYETSIRGTSAFSTLGWFDDPILSSTLKNDEVSIVNTVIHESVHTTLWAKGKVEFNESFANFIGTVGACNFFRARLKSCAENDNSCIDENNAFIKACNQDESLQYEFAAMIDKLYNELDELYKSAVSREEKVSKRFDIFDSYIKPLREKFPGMKALQKFNNAEIMQFKLYLSGFGDFSSFYGRYKQDLPAALAAVMATKKKLEKSEDPFAVINSL